MHKFLTFLLLLATVPVWAQEPTATLPTNEGLLLQHDKIYVVLGVCLIILAGLIAYLVQLDRKISRLERSK